MVKDKSHAFLGTFGKFLANLAFYIEVTALKDDYKSHWS